MYSLLCPSVLSKNVKIKIERTVILLVVVYACESWSLTLREERRMRKLEYRMVRRIFRRKRDEVTGEWRRLHDGGTLRCVLVTKYYSGDQIKNNKMGWVYSTYGREERCIQGFSEEIGGKVTTWKTQA
jgi:hypothetical protein